MRVQPTRVVTGIVMTLTLALASCSSPTTNRSAPDRDPAAVPSSSEQNSSADEGTWPRTITHEMGEVVLESQPQRIVSTSPSITGALLSIDAPLIASGAAPVTGLTDEDGFFLQWAEVAHERGVEIAYPALRIDLDAIETFEPDLIIGSTKGGDSVADEYAQLNEIAPTVMIDYFNSSWQELTTTLGNVTGRETEAAKVLESYDTKAASVKDAITLPDQPVVVIYYQGAEGATVIGPNEIHAELLKSIGFTYADTDVVSGEGGGGGNRVSTENLPALLNDVGSVFLLQLSDASPVEEVLKDPLLAAVPAVQKKNVFPLGEHAFRLDYYAAMETIDALAKRFSS